MNHELCCGFGIWHLDFEIGGGPRLFVLEEEVGWEVGSWAGGFFRKFFLGFFLRKKVTKKEGGDVRSLLGVGVVPPWRTPPICCIYSERERIWSF